MAVVHVIQQIGDGVTPVLPNPHFTVTLPRIVLSGSSRQPVEDTRGRRPACTQPPMTQVRHWEEEGVELCRDDIGEGLQGQEDPRSEAYHARCLSSLNVHLFKENMSKGENRRLHPKKGKRAGEMRGIDVHAYVSFSWFVFLFFLPFLRVYRRISNQSLKNQI